MKNNHRKTGGRPKKGNAEKRSYMVGFKTDTKGYYSLKTKASQAGLKRSEYIRRCIENSHVVERLKPEHLKLIRSLTGMANNMNQIARTANAAGYQKAAAD